LCAFHYSTASVAVFFSQSVSQFQEAHQSAAIKCHDWTFVNNVIHGLFDVACCRLCRLAWHSP